MREQHPANELAARFSTPQALGALLVLGRCGPDEFRGDALQNPDIRDVAERVFVTEDAEWEGVNPTWRGATVRVALKNGAALLAEAEQTLGDPENPLSEEDLILKFRGVTSPVIGEAASALAVARLLRLEALRGLPGLIEGLLPSAVA
jgi:2-methylcitrate dehydratase PrpD